MAESLHPVWADASGEMADPDAWKGYEFWSAQLEAQMEELDEAEWFGEDDRATMDLPAAPQDKGERDALPF